MTQLVLLVPLNLVSFIDLHFDLLLELPLPLLHAHAQCLPQPHYPLLYLRSGLLQLAQLYQGLPVHHVRLYVGIIKFDGTEGVFVLLLEKVLQLVAFRSVQIEGRVAIIYLLSQIPIRPHEKYKARKILETYNSFGVIVDSSIIVLLEVKLIPLLLILQT